MLDDIYKNYNFRQLFLQFVLPVLDKREKRMIAEKRPWKRASTIYVNVLCVR